MMIENLLEELYSYTLHGVKLGLSNIEKICEAMGNPQNNYKIIHIAGTNGKGSTSTIIEKNLIEVGKNVGKYTSPHILNFNERISVNGKNISDEDIIKYYLYVKEIIKKLDIKPTFFEVTTAIMLKYFSDLKVEYGIIEVGLGGNYDATNIVQGDITVITNVSLDHTEFLGNNVYDISKEKAGIIKTNSKVIVGSIDKDFLKAIEEKTKDYINVIKKYDKISHYCLDFKNFKTKITIDNEIYELSLFGDYQYKNFLCAYEVLKLIGIENEVIKKTATKLFWPCRMEIHQKNEKIIILDGAHNEAGAKELIETLKKGYMKDEVVGIVSILKDKNYKKIIEILSTGLDTVVYTSLKENSRGKGAKELFDENKDKIKSSYYFEELKEAYQFVNNILNKKIIVVTGSFYLLSKIKEEILKDEK